ncbi:MAG: hypothetical protein H0V01_10335 [Bacteroidetes bacterium]|nr:hypothetical protein [Bacteroidota bacterium]HET6244310.1 hypothetical protein [Bacteroidia bacterium]
MKKIGILIFGILVFNNAIISQNKFSVGLSISPDLSYRFLTPIHIKSSYHDIDMINEHNEWLVNNLNEIESPKFATTTCLNVKYKISKKLLFATGIWYSDKGISSRGFASFQGSYRFSVSRFPISDHTQQKSKNLFLEIPLSFNYIVKESDLNMFTVDLGMGFGLNANKYNSISRRAKTDYITYPVSTIENTVPTTIDPFQMLLIGFYSGFSMERKIYKNFSFILNPIFRFYPFTFFSEENTRNFDYAFRITNIGYYNSNIPVTVFPVKDKPFSIGLNVGINYKFDKN